MKTIKTIICVILALCFIGVIAYSGYQIWLIQSDYDEESKIHDMVMEYKPDEVQYPQAQNSEEKIVNQGLIDMQGTYPDVVGWLTIPNTNIDYPFVWYQDNDYYLRRDIYGNYALAGTIFMDCRCEKDFSSQNTILYGHHMKNDSMFGSLKFFGDEFFFEENKYGTVYLPNATLTLEFFAYTVINPDTEKEIYNVQLSDTYFDYIEQYARHYRDLGLTEADRVVTLSTCAYEFEDARMVLLARIKA